MANKHYDNYFVAKFNISGFNGVQVGDKIHTVIGTPVTIKEIGKVTVIGNYVYIEGEGIYGE